MSLVQTLHDEFLRTYPNHAARTLTSIPTADFSADLQTLSTDGVILTLDSASPVQAGEIFRHLTPAQQTAVLLQASPRLAVVILAQLKDAERAAVFAALPAELAAGLERQLSFPENTAGRLMDGVFTTCTRDMTVAEALAQLKQSSVQRARSLYLVDGDNRLAGRVDIQDLALEEPDTLLQTIAHDVAQPLNIMAPREQIVAVLNDHRLDSVPVVDLDNKLMGVVRYASLFQAIEDVATAGMQKMVGNADERALSTPTFAVRKRLPWLHINLLTAFLAAAVVGLFESTIAQFTALAILLPVVAGQSGNAGAQALAVTMRGLALHEISIRDWRRVLRKEVLVGFADGVALAITCGAGVLVWSGSLGLAAVIAVAMVLSMLAAGISGALVPMILTRLGQDPATASSIILTTVTDVAGFISFLGTATLMSAWL